MLEAELDTSGSGVSRENVPVTPSESAPEVAEQVPAIQPIAGFWRRLIAFLLDTALLGIVGQILGWSMSHFWFQLGPYARVVGQLIALLYFGLLDSGFGGGCTLGKRLLGLAVRSVDGQPIGVWRSMLRTLIWLVPLTLNGWDLPLIRNPIASWFASVIVLGIGGAVVVTMVFNRQSRQGLHDMLTHTYVLHLDGPPVPALPAPPRLQWILSGAILALAIVLSSIGNLLVSRLGAPLQSVMELQRTLQKDDRFFSVGVFDQTFHARGTTRRTLRIQVWYKGIPTDTVRSSVMNDVAQTALNLRDVERYDIIRVEVTSAYDLGIASGQINHGDGQPVNTWRKRVVGLRSRAAP